MPELLTDTEFKERGLASAGSLVTVTIGAGEMGSFPVQHAAFYLVTCPAPVYIRGDLLEETIFNRGTGIRYASNVAGKLLEIYNRNTFAVKLVLWYGFADYIDNRQDVLETPTKFRGWTDWATTPQQVDGNGIINITPTAEPGVIGRKSVLITNLDANEVIRLADNENGTFLTVFPRTSVELASSESFKLINDTAAALSVNIGEVLYIERGD